MLLNGQKEINTNRVQSVHVLLGSCLSIFSGFLFTYIVGYLDPPFYLLEQMTIILIELPFVVLYAVLVRKHDWMMGCLYAFLGTVVSFVLTFQSMSITPIVFMKIALMGLLLGKYNLFCGSFFRRLSAVAFPGIIIAIVLGLPLIFNGVTPEVMEEIKQDTLEVYQVFMPDDDAENMAENAVVFFAGIFKISLAFYILFAFILSWFSFLLSSWLMGKFKEDAEYVPPFYTFKMPFRAIWVLIAGGALWVSGYEHTIIIASNILAVMAGLYGMQGLAVVTYHINRFSIGVLPKIIFWLIFFLAIGFSGILLIITGVIDNWFNLRTIPYYTESGEEGNNNEGNS